MLRLTKHWHIFFALHLLLDDDVLELGAAVLPEVAEHQHLPTLVIVRLPDLPPRLLWSAWRYGDRRSRSPLAHYDSPSLSLPVTHYDFVLPNSTPPQPHPLGASASVWGRATSSASALGWCYYTPRTRSVRPPPPRLAPPAAVAPPFASPPQFPAARCAGPLSSAPPLPPPIARRIASSSALPLVSKERGASNIAALHSPVEEALEVPTRPPQGSPRCDGLSVPSYAPPLPGPPPAHATVPPVAPCVGPFLALRMLRRPIARWLLLLRLCEVVGWRRCRCPRRRHWRRPLILRLRAHLGLRSAPAATTSTAGCPHCFHLH